MSDNPTLDFLVERVKDKGWLSLSTLYFDNAYCMNIYTSRGYIAYSPSRQLFFGFNCIDTTDTKVVENTYVVMKRDNIGMQQNITVVGAEHLQHFDIAQYSHYDDYYFDQQPKMLYPTIPTKDKIMSLVKNEETGLYPGTDTVGFINDTEVSTIGLFPDVKDVYTGAVIEAWQRFYKNQEKMCAMLAEAYGVTDAI